MMTERELEDWEWPDPDEGDESSETIPCAQCGEAIYEDAVQCPACGAYVVHASGSAWTGRPWWYVLLAALGVGAAIAWLAV